MKQCICSFITNEYFFHGLRFLNKSLRQNVSAEYDYVVLTTNPDLLKKINDEGFIAVLIDDISIDADFEEQRYKFNINKFHLWNLDYDYVVYLDVDMVISSSIDELFALELSDEIHMCLDYDWRLNQYKKDYFNAGLIVLRPNKDIFSQMLANISTYNWRDCAEQDYINDHFAIKKLPDKYNYSKWQLINNPSVTHKYNILHFNNAKPWGKHGEFTLTEENVRIPADLVAQFIESYTS